MAEELQRVKLVIERTDEGYIAYPLGLKGVVIAEGDTYEAALEEARSAIRFHVETFGPEVMEEAAEAKEVFVAETEVKVG